MKEVYSLSNREKQFLNVAIKVASSSEMKKKHGAVIVKSGRVLAIGVNKFRNHPAQTAKERIKNDCSIHAEIDALSRCDPRGASLYVARVNNAGEPRFSRPCSSCREKIIESGIKKVIWSEERKDCEYSSIGF